MKSKNMKKLISLLTAGAMIGSLGMTTYAEEKPTVTLMIDIAGYAPLNDAVAMVQEHFPEYNIVSKAWDIENLKKTIKTTFAAGSGGDSVDISFTAARNLQGYVSADMLLDLSPYLDDEWKSLYDPATLEAEMLGDGIYGVPWQVAYPVLVSNEDILEAAGVMIKDEMKFDDWAEVCEKIVEAGYTPFALGDGHAWVTTQITLNAFDTNEEIDAFCAGDLPYTDEHVKAGYENAVRAFNEGWFYPGEGAIASTPEEALAGFGNGEVAFSCTTNNGIINTITQAGIENYKIYTFPTFTNSATNNILGSPDCWIVPANTRYPEATIEVLKYLSGTEVSQMQSDYGTITCNVNVTSDDPNFAEYSKDLDKIHPIQIEMLSDEVLSAAENSLAEYMYIGESALDTVQVAIDAAKTE